MTIGSKHINEISFSEGKIYKIGTCNNEGLVSRRISDNCVSSYHFSDKYLDKLFPVFAIKKNKIGEEELKYYYPSNYIYYELFNKPGGKDLSKYDLSDDVEIWVGIGEYKEIGKYDLIFSIKNDKQLNRLCEYYNLKFPLPDGISLDDNYESWHDSNFENICERNNGNIKSKFNKKFILGSIKFKNNLPIKIKVYKPYHEGLKI